MDERKRAVRIQGLLEMVQKEKKLRDFLVF